VNLPLRAIQQAEHTCVARAGYYYLNESGKKIYVSDKSLRGE
jgi:hypothetical protein